MEQVEGDLSKSKLSREKQAKEFGRQMEDERFKHQHLVCVCLCVCVSERLVLIKTLDTLSNSLIPAYTKEIILFALIDQRPTLPCYLYHLGYAHVITFFFSKQAIHYTSMLFSN